MMLGDRKQVTAYIRANGGVWSSSVTRTTDVLVIHPNELSPPTTKVQSALSLGVPIVSEKFLLDSVALGGAVAFAPYAIKKEGQFAFFLSPIQSATDLVYRVAGGIVADAFYVACVIATFVLAVPFRVVPLMLAFRWTAAENRDRDFYFKHALAAILDWAFVLLGMWVISEIRSKPGLAWVFNKAYLVVLVLIASATIGALDGIFHEDASKRVTQGNALDFLKKFGERCVTRPICMAMLVAILLILGMVAGPSAVFRRFGVARCVAAFRHLLLWVTAIPLRVIPVAIVVSRSPGPLSQSSYDQQLKLNLFDLVIICCLYWLQGFSRLMDLYSRTRLPAWALSLAGIWLIMGTVYWTRFSNTPHRKTTLSSYETEYWLRHPVTVLVLGWLWRSSVGWVVDLLWNPIATLCEFSANTLNRFVIYPLKNLVDALLPPVSRLLRWFGRALSSICNGLFRVANLLWNPIATLLEYVVNGLNQFVLYPLKSLLETIFSPVSSFIQWFGTVLPLEAIGRAFATFWNAALLVLAVLFIFVTVYRIPALIRAFRDRNAQETANETIWRALQTELAWIQSSSQQRANRWRAVAERKRLKAAQSSHKDDDDDENDDSSPRQRRSPARKASRKASKSPARRASSRSPRRRQ